MWLKNGSKFSKIDNASLQNNLENHVYEVKLGREGFYLEKILETFKFDYKIYDYDKKFIDYIYNIYQNITTNLGVILNGLRGTGKTVTAKLIANKIGLPIICVSTNFGDANDDMVAFLNSLNTDCIILMDEFEKYFSYQDPCILKLMDSAFNKDWRRVFLLTTNELTINENLLARPSRIRYIKKYNTLSESAINEFIDDTLHNKDFKEGILQFLNSLSFITIDILKVLISDINISEKFDLNFLKNHINFEFVKYNYSPLFFNVNLNGECYKTLIDKIKKIIHNFDTHNYKLSNFDNIDEDIEIESNVVKKSIKELKNLDVNYVSSTSLSMSTSIKFAEIGDYILDGEIVDIDIDLNLIVTLHENSFIRFLRFNSFDNFYLNKYKN